MVGGRRPLLEDDLWWKKPFDVRQLLMVDDLYWSFNLTYFGTPLRLTLFSPHQNKENNKNNNKNPHQCRPDGGSLNKVFG